MSTQNKSRKKTKKPAKPFSIKRMMLILWGLFLAGALAVFLVFWGTSHGLLGEMPDVQELENPDIYVSSEIYSADGVLLDRFETEKRIPVTYDDLPKHLVDALLAREDIRFNSHSGIDPRSTLRAITSGGGSGGASTITQQLAKQLFTVNRSTSTIGRAIQKLKEWVVAVELEKRYTKEEIIAMYLNKFDFVYNANGIELASKVYFNTTTQDLTLEEATMLIAMLKNPVAFNPLRNPNDAKHERNVVLNQMVKYDFLTKDEAEAAKAKPIELDKQEINTISESYSAYYKHELRREIQAYLNDLEEETGKKYNLYKDGLKIYVTLDSRMQKLAEDAVAKHLKSIQKLFFEEQKHNSRAPFYGLSEERRQRIFQRAMRNTHYYKQLKEKGQSEEEILAEFNRERDSVKIFTWDGVEYRKNMSLMDSIKYHKHILQAGMMSMDPTDGTIKAWVGGINWDYFKFDHVKQARRQVGSIFKPFVYATAINQMNYTPCNTVSNAPFQIGNWKPRNANGKYGGSQDLRTALAFSTNVITARLIAQTGVEPVIQLARDLGVESDIPKDYTIALGSADLTVYEMVGALSAFANGGIYIKPELIVRIEDKTGRIIKDYQPETREVVNEYVAYAMIDLMKGVTDRGTGRWVRTRYGINSEVASKTGTTNDQSDGWFVGITPNLITGVWVGNEDRFAHFRGIARGQGAATALPIWSYYMQGVYKNGKEFGVLPTDKFEKPSDIDEKWDCSSLTGFHSYGSMGGTFDYDYSGVVDYVDPLQSVNTSDTEGDTIDFNQ
ncbi:MAG: peptidoglycan glycosyltransferase [Flavobacteriaceae bacterium]|jgi:penicillin-binding protein 1A|nr:peptidoglycan glycosyltransferase [Flavobacteriaceae bacterium]